MIKAIMDCGQNTESEGIMKNCEINSKTSDNTITLEFKVEKGQSWSVWENLDDFPGGRFKLFLTKKALRISIEKAT